MELNEKIRLVHKVDSWSQENDRELDNQFSCIYDKAIYTDNGWEDIATKEPCIFDMAYRLALKHENRVTEDY